MLQPTPTHTLDKGQALFTLMILVVPELNPDLLTARMTATQLIALIHKMPGYNVNLVC